MRLIQHDPRLVQAMGVLNGYRVSATEADVRAAERVGDIKKRDAIQTADVEAALRCATVAEAKAAGNEHFKAGAHSKALACYARARAYSSTARRQPRSPLGLARTTRTTRWRWAPLVRARCAPCF